MKKYFRPLYFRLLDLFDWGQRLKNGKLYWPPLSLRDVGDSDFEATGLEFVNHFKKLCYLQPNENILEIGCGSGRIAMPLTNYLNPSGHYYGIEIVADMVKWCQKNISSRHPNFKFIHADLYNKRYNPDATQLAKDYTFPFDNATFDFIYLTSVFTHLLPEDTEAYFQEISRLLKPNGRVFATFFVLNDRQQQLAKQGLNVINFNFECGTYSLKNETIPEFAVAYQENYLLQLLHDCGLVISPPIIYGSWSGLAEAISLQDFIIARRVQA